MGASGTELTPIATEDKPMTGEWLQMSDSGKATKLKRTFFQHRKSSLRCQVCGAGVRIAERSKYKPFTSRCVVESVEGIGGATTTEKVSAIPY